MNILFLCTGNSARSILAEALTNHLGQGRVTAYSAGSFPKGQPHPLALDILKKEGVETAGLRSKSWDEFARPGAPQFDVAITVCDAAAQEVCPVWPGKPLKVHWGIPDPAAVQGGQDEKLAAFKHAYATLQQRITAFLAAGIERLAPGDTQDLLKKLGEMTP